MAPHKRGPWSSQEDSYLINLVNQQGAHNWVRISSIIQTRSPKQCRERYHQNLKPTLNHSPITPEEGRLIERLVSEMGKKWAEIARHLPGRSDNSVKNWWNGGVNRRNRGGPSGRRLDKPLYREHHQHHHQLSDPHVQIAGPSPLYATQGSQLLPPIGHSRSYPPQPINTGLHTYDTPLPSPSALSVGSAPSLVSDTTISPRPGNSPLEQPGPTLPPITRASDERRGSASTISPYGHTTYSVDDGYVKREDSYRMHLADARAPPQAMGWYSAPPQSSARPQLLSPLRSPYTENQYSAHPQRPAIATESRQLPPIQAPLPAFSTLGQPGAVPTPQFQTPQSAMRPPSPPSTGPSQSKKMDLSKMIN